MHHEETDLKTVPNIKAVGQNTDQLDPEITKKRKNK